MDEERNESLPPEESASAYRDALYSQAPENRRGCYGYSPAQCYARASAGMDETPPKKKKNAGALVAAVAVLLAAMLVVGIFGSGSLLLASRADAASEDSRELYEDFVAAQDRENDLILAESDDGEQTELSAEDIYVAACSSTVGVTIPGYTRNVFGQLSASTVTGTGIVLTADGYILTNYHVIETAYSQGIALHVLTYDGAEYEADVIGIETDSDLAVLHIDAEGLVPAVMGDSDGLRVGQSIYTVGNPLGELTYTMTSGIVSALDRRITTDVNATVNMFQIDAAVNNGSSGGPVYDIYGRVIGVVTAKYSLDGMEGLGFAIPINNACKIAEDLVEKGYVTGKAYLGLNTATVSPSTARYYDLVQGVYVYFVEADSCAEAAGLMAGDVITAVDGEPVLTSSQLVKTVKLYRAGDSADFTVYRGQETVTIPVVFDEELPAEPIPGSASAELSSGDITVREG